ncbi:MAG: hypothetical protein ACKO2N_10815 [Tabrizicola sp.]
MKNLTAAATVFAIAMSFGSSAFACFEGDCEPPPPPEESKGNNGWGNGIDGTNPGSFAGPASQVDTKTNVSVWDKFQGKFEGR